RLGAEQVGAIFGTDAVVILLVLGVVFVLWVSALVSVLTFQGRYIAGSQLIWILVVLLGGPIGAVLYFLMARDRRYEPREALPDRRRRVHEIADPWHERTDEPGA
ncbi:MAG: hypothetical protein ACRDYC_03510, partial [Acidimicrobiales bacterium]